MLSLLKIKIGLKQNVFLFLFIRKYKGLHNVIPAFKKLSNERKDVSLLICGEEFWKTVNKNKLSIKIKSFLFGLAKKIFLRTKNDEHDYNPLKLIKDLNVNDCHVFSEFIPNEDVHSFFRFLIVFFYSIHMLLHQELSL